MTVEQWLGSIMAFAIVIAAINVLMGGFGITARLALRPGSGRGRDVDDWRDASPARAKRKRHERNRPHAVRNLSNVQRAQYVKRWRHLHRRAIALPATTLLDADDLLTHVLDDIGYPTEGFVQYAADLSAAHAEVVDDYRVARNIVLDTRLGLADTAQIRHALPRYVAVFECLAEVDVSSQVDEAAA